MLITTSRKTHAGFMVNIVRITRERELHQVHSSACRAFSSSSDVATEAIYWFAAPPS